MGLEVCVVTSQVWEALGEERTEELWTWATGGAPPASDTQSEQAITSYHLTKQL